MATAMTVSAADLNLDLSDARLGRGESLEARIADFKSDPERMKCVREFVNEICDKAQKDVHAKQGSKLIPLSADLDEIKGSVRQWHSRARGFVSRVFTAICNCTKTGNPVAVARSS